MTELPYTLRDDQAWALDKFEGVQNIASFDEMGYGKTVLALERDRRLRLKWRGKTLIVTLSGAMVDHWYRHVAWMAPHLKAVKLDPKKRTNSWREFREGADIFIVHWECLRLMPELQEIKWLHVIGDEIHRIMHRNTAMAKSLKRLKTEFKFGLSGTPSTGRPDLLWSILNWLYPQKYRSYWKFFEDYVEYDYIYRGATKYKEVLGPKNELQLQAEIAPFTVRRLKRDLNLTPGVLPSQPFYVELGPEQRRAYNQMRDDMISWVRDNKTGEDEMTPLIAQAAISRLIRLQQFACSYATVEGSDVFMSEPSSKLDFVMERLDEGLGEGKKMVVFSTFKQLVKLLNTRLERAKIDYVSIHGDVKQADRGPLVQRFQNGNAEVFTGTFKAGGVGIDLFASNHVILMNRDWDPTANEQGIGRLDRHGQTSLVTVDDIISIDTCEPEKNERVQTKWSWVQRLLGDI